MLTTVKLFQANFFLDASVTFLESALPKHHKLEGLKQPKLVLSQSWSPEVQNQGIDRATLRRF